MLIHHQVKGAKTTERQLGSQAHSRLRDWDKIPFWLHESKLLEGVDDSSFVAIALYDGFDNARQLIQQIGRALRTTDKTRHDLRQPG